MDQNYDEDTRRAMIPPMVPPVPAPASKGIMNFIKNNKLTVIIAILILIAVIWWFCMRKGDVTKTTTTTTAKAPGKPSMQVTRTRVGPNQLF